VSRKAAETKTMEIVAVAADPASIGAGAGAGASANDSSNSRAKTAVEEMSKTKRVTNANLKAPLDVIFAAA